MMELLQVLMIETRTRLFCSCKTLQEVIDSSLETQDTTSRQARQSSNFLQSPINFFNLGFPIVFHHSTVSTKLSLTVLNLRVHGWQSEV